MSDAEQDPPTVKRSKRLMEKRRKAKAQQERRASVAGVLGVTPGKHAGVANLAEARAEERAEAAARSLESKPPKHPGGKRRRRRRSKSPRRRSHSRRPPVSRSSLIMRAKVAAAFEEDEGKEAGPPMPPLVSPVETPAEREAREDKEEEDRMEDVEAGSVIATPGVPERPNTADKQFIANESDPSYHPSMSEGDEEEEEEEEEQEQEEERQKDEPDDHADADFQKRLAEAAQRSMEEVADPEEEKPSSSSSSDDDSYRTPSKKKSSSKRNKRSKRKKKEKRKNKRRKKQKKKRKRKKRRNKGGGDSGPSDSSESSDDDDDSDGSSSEKSKESYEYLSSYADSEEDVSADEGFREPKPHVDAVPKNNVVYNGNDLEGVEAPELKYGDVKARKTFRPKYLTYLTEFDLVMRARPPGHRIHPKSVVECIEPDLLMYICMYELDPKDQTDDPAKVSPFSRINA